MVELAHMDHEAQYMPPGLLRGRHPAGRPSGGRRRRRRMDDEHRAENIEAHEKTIAAELLKLGDVDGICTSGR